MRNDDTVPNQREAVIMAILLHGEKFGREVRDLFQTRTKKSLPLGSLYTTLERMEKKGFVRSRVGESTHERGGNKRSYYKLTASGLRAFSGFRRSLGDFIEGAIANA